MANPPPGLDIVILKMSTVDEIVEKSKNAPFPYTREKLIRMYQTAMEANCAVFISFINEKIWE